MPKKCANQFKIVEQVYIDEYGKEQGEKGYIIEIEKPFLFFWSYWATIKHEEYGGMGDSYKTTTVFKTKTDAMDFIENVLRPKRKCREWVYREIKRGRFE